MISLVMTTYNHAPYIREALDSVVMQNIEELQVIVVDDGSQDGTLEIIQEYKRLGFEVLTKINGGPSHALNYGLSHATGDFIVFLSGDDKLEADSIEKRVSVLQRGTVDIVTSIPNWIDGKGSPLPSTAHPALFKPFSFDDPLELFLLLYNEGNMICAPSVAMTRSCWKTVGVFNDDLWQLQDYEYWLRACAKGQAFMCLNEACISYRWHGKNLSLSNREASEKEWDAILQTAPEWLGREQLIALLWGKEMEFEPELNSELLRALLCVRNSRVNVSNVGKWMLRYLARKEQNRDMLIKYLF